MTDEAENLGTRYRIDAGRGSFTVQAFAEGMLSFMGHNPTFAVRRYGGEIQFANGDTQVESMLIVAQSESLALLDNVSDKDRAEIGETMRETILETDKFSEIYFVSKDVSIKEISNGTYSVIANGVISLHGETHPKTIEAVAEINNGNVKATGEFLLKQSDFNIEQVKALGGNLKVKDEVKISFEIAANV